jgi:DNA polymerase family A
LAQIGFKDALVIVKSGFPRVVKNRRPSYYADAILKVLFAAAEPWEVLFLAHFLFTGMREDEVAHLFWTNVLWHANEIEVKDKPEWGGPLAQTAERRRAARAINFGIIYGLSAFGLAQQLGIEQKEAAQFINAYFTRYRGVKEYLDNVLVETRKTDVAKTLFGRIRPIPEINAPQMQLRNFAERTALNSPLQGTAADLIKLAMIAIDERLREKKLAARMILQVHDELLFGAPVREREMLESSSNMKWKTFTNWQYRWWWRSA